MIEDIENFREEQYADYSIYLGKSDAIELSKCDGCGIDVENENEYCKECIEYYKS
jgi:hypothetical protein